MEALTRAQRIFDRQVGEAKAASARLASARAEVAELEQRLITLDETSAILNSFADSRAEEVTKKIEGLVTHGLRTIFGDQTLAFHARSKTVGRRTETHFTVSSGEGDDKIETPVMEARGGGVAAVAGFLLRLIVILLRKDVRPLLFLDETFAQLSAEFEPALAEFMRELVDKTPAQIVMVTHSSAYDDAADRAYRFSQEGGKTKAVELT